MTTTEAKRVYLQNENNEILLPYSAQALEDGDGNVISETYVKRNSITNCILEAPNGVMELAADGINFTLKQGLKVLIPNGRNADGTLKNTETTLTSDAVYTGLTSASNLTFYAFVDAQGAAHATSVYQSGMYEDIDDSIVANQAILYFAFDTNKTYLRTQSATSWTEVSWAFVGTITKTSANSTVLPEQPLNLLKLSDLNNIVKIKQTYINGTSGYIIWSNGYCEQWGQKLCTVGSVSVTFLKTFANTNYCVIGQRNEEKPAYSSPCCHSKTTTSFKIKGESSELIGWRANGYLAADQY